MNRENNQKIRGVVCAFVCAFLPVAATGQQPMDDPFVENLRQRNEVTSEALRQSPLAGILGVIRGDHLKGSGQRGAAPLFSGDEQPVQQRRPAASRSQTEKTRLSLRNPLEGSVGWLQSQTTTSPAYRQQPSTTAAPTRAVAPVPRQPVAQQQREGGWNRLLAGLTQKQETRQPAARRSEPTRDGGVFAFLRRDGAVAESQEGDWSREAQRRTSARSQMTRAQSPKVQLASLDRPTAEADAGGALNRLIQKSNFNSWMAVPEDEEEKATPVQPKPKKKSGTAAGPQMTTWEKRYVKSDRTGFHAVGKRLDAKSPDRYLSQGTTLHVTNKGWNWSNVVLSDGGIGSVQTSLLSRTPIEAKPPKSVRSRSKLSAESRAKLGFSSPSRSERRKVNPSSLAAKEQQGVDRGGASPAKLERLAAAEPSAPIDQPEKEMSRAVLDAALEPSLESLLDPGVEATLRDLEEELLLPLPPDFPEDVDTGAGKLPPLN